MLIPLFFRSPDTKLPVLLLLGFPVVLLILLGAELRVPFLVGFLCINPCVVLVVPSVPSDIMALLVVLGTWRVLLVVGYLFVVDT